MWWAWAWAGGGWFVTAGKRAAAVADGQCGAEDDGDDGDDGDQVGVAAQLTQRPGADRLSGPDQGGAGGQDCAGSGSPFPFHAPDAERTL